MATFLIPMRGNERYCLYLTSVVIVFLIPMRGNEGNRVGRSEKGES